jgi:1,4-dihydroxy-2-naphthoate octaprenyltransferase
VLYALGAAVAAAHGHTIDPVLYVLGQAAVTIFQLMTHYANDYFDYEADHANTTPTRWSGGSRVLVGGELPRGVALGVALLLAATGLGVMLALSSMERTGPLALPALVVALVLSWEYSAPPLCLHSSGLGELAVALVVTALVPFFGFYLQAPDLVGVRVLLLAVAPLCCLQFAMLLAIEVPDAAGDRAVGKRTLVVRLGTERATRLYMLTVAAAYASLPVLAAAGLPKALALAAAVPAPVALWRITRTRAGDFRRPERWESVTFWAVALLVGTAVVELVGITVFF